MSHNCIVLTSLQVATLLSTTHRTVNLRLVLDMPKDSIWEDMHDRLSAPWITRGSPPAKCFITREELRTAWSGKLETFAKGVGLGLAKSEFGIVEGKFLKMLSILVMIEYESWPKFKKNFLDHKDGDGRLDRTDESLPISQQDSKNSGLGLQDYEAQRFEIWQYRFVPIILKQELEPLVLHTSRPLPFVNPNPLYLGSGVGGTVYKEVIAARCLSTPGGLENEVCSLINMIVNGADIPNSGGKECCQEGNEASRCQARDREPYEM